MSTIRLVLATLAIVSATSGFSSAQCVVDDDYFSTEDGGCKDLFTGLVWSPDLRGITGNPNAQGVAAPDFYCERAGIMNPYNGHSDWRVPTLGEVEEAVANGLNFHLDFFLDGGPDDGSYRYTTCSIKQRGVRLWYAIRFSDGDTKLTNGTAGILCVRGAPSDNDCPSNKKGGGNGSKHSMWLPRTTTGAILLFPLCLVVAGCSVKRRWF
ncbi:DUF1566 domain-containing protein [Bythopirellula polymerisocia]|uniref:DUF1566 domain-containing protein n=1 Tax=Bythopirellula polymerisocia TaxID=2528003 RepID=A0A5C6CYA2_9BACT|nr:DUF1566 domain-containing protein [Bythopirellula polymerisocia]TWU28461.1 hypothetical protein Pla144_17510 [Bythopirellula polymerisocia]